MKSPAAKVKCTYLQFVVIEYLTDFSETSRQRGGFRDRNERPDRSDRMEKDNEYKDRGERGGRTFRNSNRDVPPRRERQMNQEGEKSPEFRQAFLISYRP